MDADEISEKIISLRAKDEKLRKKQIRNRTLSIGYDSEMEALHNSNARELNELMAIIGYPTAEKVGQEASEAAWLIIQHSIGQPDFMKKAAKLLEEAVQEGVADPQSLAYLTDRIAVFEGRPQLYGTQFDWDDNGEMHPTQLDDFNKVNQRRKAIGFNTLEEQAAIMKERVKNENQRPPKDIEERKRVYDEWRKSVGWIKSTPP